MLKDHYENKRLKINAPLRGIKAGTTINIRTDKKGIPKDKYWRDRLRDSAIDNCVEIIKETKTAKSKRAETTRKGE